MKRKLIVPFNTVETAESVSKATPAADKQKERKTRIDKRHPRKFSVTYAENRMLTNFFLENKVRWRTDSITEFLTMMLRIGLRKPVLISKPLLYETKTPYYKTVKPNTYEKELLSGVDGLSIQLGLFNERATIHRVVLNVLDYLHKGGSIRYEDIQPLKPSSGSHKR